MKLHIFPKWLDFEKSEKCDKGKKAIRLQGVSFQICRLLQGSLQGFQQAGKTM